MPRRQLSCEMTWIFWYNHEQANGIRFSSGVDGIVVSNHAGRQVDGGISSLDALEKIVDAVGDKIYVRCILRPPYENV